MSLLRRGKAGPSLWFLFKQWVRSIPMDFSPIAIATVGVLGLGSLRLTQQFFGREVRYTGQRSGRELSDISEDQRRLGEELHQRKRLQSGMEDEDGDEE